MRISKFSSKATIYRACIFTSNTKWAIISTAYTLTSKVSFWGLLHSTRKQLHPKYVSWELIIPIIKHAIWECPKILRIDAWAWLPHRSKSVWKSSRFWFVNSLQRSIEHKSRTNYAPLTNYMYNIWHRGETIMSQFSQHEFCPSMYLQISYAISNPLSLIEGSTVNKT